MFAGSNAPVLEALAALDRELVLASRPGIEHSVAHTKLAWWRGEIERLGHGRPQHPLTRALLKCGGPATDWSLLFERLDAADLALGGFAPATLAELEALIYRARGTLWQLLACLLAGRSSPALLAYGAALGKGVGLVEYLNAAGPAGAIARADVRARAAALLSSAAALLPPADRRALAPGSVAAALATAALAGRGKRAFVQVFIAWRAARRAPLTELP